MDEVQMSASAAALRATKKELRTLMKQKLSNISPESVALQSNRVLDALSNFKPYQDAQRVGIYLAMPGGELQTEAIVRHAFLSGKQIFVPYLHKAESPIEGTPSSVMDMVKLQNLDDFESLGRDKWGIPSVDQNSLSQRERVLGELSSGPPTRNTELDMILVPGVAFGVDHRTGFIRRLGHGKGFYDYFLHRYSQAAKNKNPSPNLPDRSVALYGLCLTEQFLEGSASDGVPVGELDRLLQGVILGSGEIREWPA